MSHVLWSAMLTGREFHNAKPKTVEQTGHVEFAGTAEPDLACALVSLARAIRENPGSLPAPPVQDALVVTIVVDRPKAPAPTEAVAP